MKVQLFVLVLSLSLTEMFFAQVPSSSAHAPQDRGSADRPSIALPCRGDDSETPETSHGEAAEPIIQNGHAGTITTMAFSPHGTILATGSQDGTVKLWLVRTGQLVRSLFVSSYWVYSLAFSPNGCTLAVGSGDHKVYLWNLDNNTQLPPLDAHAGAVKALAFSPDGTLLASGTTGTGSTPMTTIWEVANGQQLFRLRGSAQIHDLAFVPGSSVLAIASGTRLQLWNYRADRFENDVEAHSDAASRLFVSADGSLLVSAGMDARIQNLGHGASTHSYSASLALWSLSGGKADEKSVNRFADLWGVGLARDGTSIIALTAHELALYRDAPPGTILPAGEIKVQVCSTKPFACHIEEKPVLTRVDVAALSANGACMAFSSGPEIILVTKSGDAEKRLSPSQALGVSAVEVSESGSLMAAGLRDGQFSVWEKPSRATYRSLQPSQDGFSQAIRAIGFNQATNTVFGASRTGGVIKWDLTSSQPPRLIREAAQGVRGDSSLGARQELGLVQIPPPTALQASVDGVPQNPGTEESLATAIAADGTIATGGLYFDPTVSSGFVSLTSPGASKSIRHLVDGGDVTALAFSRDGSMLAIGSARGGIDILRMSDRSIVTKLNGHSASINGLAFSPNGELLASASVDKTVGLWNLKEGGPGRMLAGHESPVLCVGLSGEDEALLASGSADNKILLWNTKSGKLVHTLEGHTSAVNALAFVAGQKTLVSGGEDASVRFWNTSTFQLLATLLPVGGGPDWLITTPSGFFDGKEGTWGQVLWQFNRNLFDVSPVEIGFRDYFVPNLLAKVLGGQAPATPRSLATLNRVQPIVRVLSVTPDSPGTVQVNVEVEGTASKTHTDETGHGQQSGVYDLRIFRDRQLSGRWPDVAEVADSSSDLGLEAWRRLHSVLLRPDGKAVVSFHHVRVPRGDKTNKVDFTAYAFNSDRVKSVTSAALEYQLPKSSAAATRRAYLVTVGVNANQSHNLNLELAVSSAESVRALLRLKLKSVYPEVVEIPLYSDLDPDTNRVKSKTATRADLKAVLDLLAGRVVDQSLTEEVDPRHQLRAAGPDDAVLLYIASHGYADPQGTFYLMPYDTGSNWGITEDVLTRCLIRPDHSPTCTQAKDLLTHSVSSFDLAAWWSGVDAGEIVMILDSCHSGAVPGREFRPGPLGDPGFGQLSYDKGMVILSASQPAQTEKGEWVSGGGGHTLLADALKTVSRVDPQHTVQQWLHDAEQQLPTTAKHLYPTLREEEIPIPVLLDFAGPISNAAGGSS